MSRIPTCLTAILAVGAAALLQAADPKPVFEAPDAAGLTEEAAAPLVAAGADNISVGFYVRFDRLPSVGSPTGLFGCSADREGHVTVRLSAIPTDMLGDYEMTTHDTVKKGEWHHVSFVYSRLRRRAALYLDGAFQWENDNLHLPRLRFGQAAGDGAFRGGISDLRVYDTDLEHDELLPATPDRLQAARAAIAADAAAVAATAKADGLRKWAADIDARSAALAARPGATTCGQLRRLRAEAANALRIARDAGGASSGPVANSGALYVVPPLSQEPILPYEVPACGVLTNRLVVIASPGEYESASIVVQAFAPTKIKGVNFRPFSGPNGAKLEPSDIDVKIVKRWFRSGLSWLSYHNDKRQRNLTPDLLMNDDAAIRVDEYHHRNYLRLAYPADRGGTVYADVSDPDKGHTGWYDAVPFADAKTLQPLEITEAGRNQQYYLTFHIPADAKPGLYKGGLWFSVAGGDLGLDVWVRVLPIDLPAEPSPYDRLDEVYITHMNSLTPPQGATLADREAFARDELASVKAHNMNHTTDIWGSPQLVKLSLEAGFIPDYVFGTPFGKPPYWKSFFPGTAATNLTLLDREAGIKASLRAMRPWRKYFGEHFPKSAIQYILYHSESQRYITLSVDQAEEGEAARRLGMRVFAHGWDNNSRWAGDIQDMHSSTAIDGAEARRWHAAGADLINYADPFPGSENPMWYRRKAGFMMYKTGLDGQMMHGFRNGRTPWNEWAEDWGGDGNYRNFALCYPMHGGQIYSLSWEGMREAYDDLRYLTRLQQLAKANLDAEAIPLKREARRAMLWLEKQDPATADLDMLRAGAIDRILLLQDAIAKHKGATPPADMAYASAQKK